MYPGDPGQYDGPSLAAETAKYRNLALHRPAMQSGAFDYDLTAQLVTDGIRSQEMPRWIETLTSDKGALPKTQRNVFLDGTVVSSIDVAGDHPWVELRIHGGALPEVDHVNVSLRKLYGAPPEGGWNVIVSGSNDGSTWQEAGRYHGTDFPGQHTSEPGFVVPVAFSAPARYQMYRVAFDAPAVKKWGVGDLDFSLRGQHVPIAGPEVFASAWMPEKAGDWVWVDLGAKCTFDRIVLAWLRRGDAVVDLSDDGAQWRRVEIGAAGSPTEQEIRLSHPEHARWVRVTVNPAAGTNASTQDLPILSELEVWGRGGPVPAPQPAATAQADGTLRLARGKWRLQRASQVSATGEQLAQPGFSDKEWMIATVPGTVLTSYLNDGAIVDPNFGVNQYAVSDAFFCADFWYRNEFVAPNAAPGRHVWLNFDGINWKAQIFLNGKSIGRIEGGYMRGKLDVTTLVHPGQVNALAVRIERSANPGGTKDKEGPTVNGGALGRDNPTYHAAAGWDWMPTIRGRDTGIWGEVTLTQTGGATIEYPLVTTTLPLPDTSSADVQISATVRNNEAHGVSGILRASFGDVVVETNVTLEPSSAKIVEFTPATNAALHIAHPRLWWPNEYGDPNLYPVKLSFVTHGAVSDTREFQAGIRQFTYSEDGGILKLWINGRRFIAKGGNWGFPESQLRYRAREYDVAMRFHREQHFNMVRNWVGQTGDEAFYSAADRHGIVVWQDFWLANPWDGPDPDNNDFFLTVARDYLLRIRNHASLGLFCGRNEGLPPRPVDDGLRAMVAELEPNSHYISSSADGPVSGHGPYQVEPLRYYFEHAPTKFHSEIGSPNAPEISILRRTLSPEGMWPLGPEWRLHDFYPENPFETAVDASYGGATSLEQWDSFAQFINYNTYRGMFEGQSKNRLGLLIWMSHPAWPSILWQTYDYFFDTDSAYYAAKKACEPLHVQWNAASDTVEVVNYSAGDQKGLTARAEVLDADGTVKWQKTATLDSREDSTESPIKLEFPAALAKTHYLRLTLQRGDQLLSANFYLHGREAEDFAGIRTLDHARLAVSASVTRAGATWTATVQLHNNSKTPALMVRAKIVGTKSNEPILPVFFDDNYVALMPGESRTIRGEFENADTRGEQPLVVVSGFNADLEK